MGIRAAVVGASGYSGGELLRLIEQHPTLELGALVAGGNAGRPVTELHPQLVALADRVLRRHRRGRTLHEADLVFLALPHGESAGAVVERPARADPVVDLGADFRLRRRRLGAVVRRAASPGRGRTVCPSCRASAKRSRRQGGSPIPVAMPPRCSSRSRRCWPRAWSKPADLVVVAGSGTSGAGRGASVDLLASEVMGDLSAYKVGGAHQHTPEIRQSLSAIAGGDVSLSFTPMLAPMPRGILATCTAQLRPGADATALRAAFSCYDDEPFVTLLPEGQLAAHRSDCWFEQRPPAGGRGRRRRTGGRGERARQPRQGRGRDRPSRTPTLMLGLPETAGLPTIRDRPVSVTARRGSGRPASPPG